MVWVHVGLATATWVTIMWSVAAAGRVVPRTASAPDSTAEALADGIRVPAAGRAS
jgi:hypothetical protein